MQVNPLTSPRGTAAAACTDNRQHRAVPCSVWLVLYQLTTHALALCCRLLDASAFRAAIQASFRQRTFLIYALLRMHTSRNCDALSLLNERSLTAGYMTRRFALAVSIAPIFEKAIQYTSRRLNISKRNSFGLYLILLGTCTSILVFGSIAIFAGPQAFAR